MTASPTAATTIRESGWNVVYGLVPAAAAFVLTPLVIDELGVETFGVYQSLAALVAFAGILNLGLGPAMIRLVAANADDGQRATDYVRTTNALTVVGAVFGALVVALAAGPLERMIDPPDAMRGEVSTALLATAALVAIALVRAQLAWILQAHHRFMFPAGVEAAVFTATMVGVAAVAWGGGGLVAAITVRLVVEAAACIAVALTVADSLRSSLLTFGFAAGTARPIAAFAPYAAVAQIANIALISVDRLLVAGLSGAAHVPLYAVPMTASVLFSSIGARAGMALFPLAAHIEGAANDHSDRIRAGYVRAARLLALLAVGAPVIVAVAGRDLLGVWIDRTFAADSGMTTSLVFVLSGMSLMSVVPSAFAGGIGRPKVNAVLALVRVIVALTFGIILTRSNGAEGMATALLIAGGVTVPALAWFVERRLIGLSSREARAIYAGPAVVLVCTVISAVLLRWLIDPTTAFRALGYLIAASVVHVAVVVGVGAVPDEDRRAIRSGLAQMVRRTRRAGHVDDPRPDR